MTDPIIMEVWIHSHYQTKKPQSVDVFSVNGYLDMNWFSEIFDKDNGPELAERFYEYLKRTEDYAFFKVQPSIESDVEIGTTFDFEILEVIEKQNSHIPNSLSFCFTTLFLNDSTPEESADISEDE